MKQELIYILVIYLIFTLTEYMLHRFIMHKETTDTGVAHVTHHKHTNDHDMTLFDQDTPDYQIIMPQENLILGATEYVPIFIAIIVTAFLYKKYFAPKLSKTVLIGVPLIGCIYTVFAWNSIHPYIHSNDGTDYTPFAFNYNLTDKCVKNNPLCSWIVQNHVKHHQFKGKDKGNYNITVPGADFIFNTYN